MDATILEAIPGTDPSGTNLRYEQIYGEIRMRVRRARGEVLPHPDDPDFHGADADWWFVVRACRDVLKRRSKDLLIAAWLTEAQFALDGFAGLRDGLDILLGLTEKFWEALYPEIEDGDAEARLRVFELLDIRLADAVRSESVSGEGRSDTETNKTDEIAAKVVRLRRERELDACVDSLARLATACREKFGDEAPEFVKLRNALVGMIRADLASLLKDIQYDRLVAAPKLDAASHSPTIAGLQELRDRIEELRREKAKASPPTSVVFPPSAPLPAPGASESRQKVDFTLTAPGAVAPYVPFEIFIWAHEAQEREQVLVRARAELGVRDVLARTKGPFRISTGTMLSVRLSIPGAVIDEAEDAMVWEGESTCVSFVVMLPELSWEAKCSGSSRVYANGVQVAKIPFLLSASGVGGMVEASSVRYRTAFASYASPDRDAVLGRIQVIHKVAPELEVFLDVLSLRSGQNWEKELSRVIPASDIFYLFWSTHARKSEWVEKEWRCALRERGIEFIDPIPLESPQESPPPPELSSLHFNDWELAFRRGKSSL